MFNCVSVCLCVCVCIGRGVEEGAKRAKVAGVGVGRSGAFEQCGRDRGVRSWWHVWRRRVGTGEGATVGARPQRIVRAVEGHRFRGQAVGVPHSRRRAPPVPSHDPHLAPTSHRRLPQPPYALVARRIQHWPTRLRSVWHLTKGFSSSSSSSCSLSIFFCSFFLFLSSLSTLIVGLGSSNSRKPHRAMRDPL